MNAQVIKAELLDLAKVGTIGTSGTFATITLAHVSAIVSIAVGVMTFLYVGTKLYYLIKSGGKGKLD